MTVDLAYTERLIERTLDTALQQMPAVALLGARQCGKSTLARHLLAGRDDVLYLDLERPVDLRRLEDPEGLFAANSEKLICIDEIQRLPELFPVLRYTIDSRGRNGQFLLLGSASRDLVEFASETLAGRIRYLDLSPFLRQETANICSLQQYWLRGGFPRSLLANTDEISFEWRWDFIRSFLERDVPLLRARLSPTRMEHLWTLLAHGHGQLLNKAELARALQVDAHTVNGYLDILEAAFMVRRLPPYFANLKKRLVRSPKVYLRDCGLVHALLNVATTNDLLGHPVRGHSWEGLVLDNILPRLKKQVRATFYRTVKGAEIDLILEMGNRRIAFEAKASQSPRLEKGFWIAMRDLAIKSAWVVAPVDSGYPAGKGVNVVSMDELFHQPELQDWLSF